MQEDDEFEAVVRAFVGTQGAPDLATAAQDRITSTILDGLPEFAADTELAASIRRSASSQWSTFLASLTEPEQTTPMVPHAAQMAVTIAHSGHSLKELFRVYRLARRGVWEHLKDVLDERLEHGDGAALLIFVWDRVSQWIDEMAEASGALFENERDLVRDSEAAQRLGIVREVLGGHGHADERALADDLGGHPVSGYNTALVLTTSDVAHVRDLTVVALDFARTVGVRNPLIINPGGRDLWVWLGTARPPAIDALLAARPALLNPGLRVAVGSPGRGIEGFRQSHQEASQAQHVAAAAKDAANPLYFPTIETLALLWQSGEQAVRFVQRTLGDLARDEEPMSRLRQTARATLHAGSIERAAESLLVHKNTVRYRLSQIEKIIGRALNDDPVTLTLALDFYEAFLEDSDAHPARPATIA